MMMSHDNTSYKITQTRHEKLHTTSHDTKSGMTAAAYGHYDTVLSHVTAKPHLVSFDLTDVVIPSWGNLVQEEMSCSLTCV